MQGNLNGSFSEMDTIKSMNVDGKIFQVYKKFYSGQ